MKTETNPSGARMWKESGFAKFKALSPYLADITETKQRTTGLGRPVYGDRGCSQLSFDSGESKFES